MVFVLLLALAQETVAIPETKLRFELASVPGGKVTLGDEKTRQVELKPFQMGTREVTWAEFNAFRFSKDLDAVTRPTNADSYFGDAGVPSEFLTPKSPLTNVRWHSAAMYCEWLSRRTGRYFRLPTEAEWEAAARAGSDKPSLDAPDDVAWHRGNSEKSTHVGGTKKANAYGIYDLNGNVWEYALEPFAPPRYGPVLRGGCWSSGPADLKFAARQTIPYKWFSEDTNDPRSVWWLTVNSVSIGFRVVCTADASDTKEREAYASKIEVKLLKNKYTEIKNGPSTTFWREVSGEIVNTGDKSLDEVELKVYYLETDGTPHLIDQESVKPGRAAFGKVWPVLVNCEATLGQPLAPGATRAFVLDVPLGFDIENKKNPVVRFGATVTALKFTR